MTILQAVKHSSTRTGLRTLLFVLSLAAGQASTHAAQPTVKPLFKGRWANTARSGSEGFDVAVVGIHAYLAGGETGLHVIDVRDPANCVRVGGYDTIGVALGVSVSGGYAYVADYTNGLQVIDVRNPANCVNVGNYATSVQAKGVVVSGNYAYIVGCASWIDRGSGLFACVDWGLEAFDISDPAHCVRLGRYAANADADSVTVSGNYAYVANNLGSLEVINVSNPANLVRVGGLATIVGAMGVAVSGNYAYVADPFVGLEIINVTNPRNCVSVGYYSADFGGFNRVAVSGRYAFAIDALTRLYVIDVNDPTNCVLVNRYRTSGQPLGVTVVANQIYVVNRTYADVTDACLEVLPTLPNVQHALRIDATLSVPFTLEAATNLADPNSWQPLLTTNVATMPFDFVDFDVKAADKPQKFYRVRQP